MNDKKQQRIEYIDGKYCHGINNFFLDDGWRVISITPVSDRDHFGAYVLLEEEEKGEALNHIGVTTYGSDGMRRPIHEVIQDIAEKWSELQ